ncbi:MAG TPA: hypothetical protein VD999_02705 [Vitreimonas sp.]|nr:hypothetical protein [Vitreimonas sp.]
MKRTKIAPSIIISVIALGVVTGLWLNSTSNSQNPATELNLTQETSRQLTPDLAIGPERVVSFTSIALPSTASVSAAVEQHGHDTLVLYKLSMPTLQVEPYLKELRGPAQALQGVGWERHIEDNFDDSPLAEQYEWWNVREYEHARKTTFSNQELNRHYRAYWVEEGEHSWLFVEVHNT